MSKEPYELRTDLNVINHLGLNLYSNVSAVLSEIIANAWDAEARRVDISISTEKGKNKRITIEDNGCGMNDNDLRDKFLTVGYERRSKDDISTDETPNMKRPVMGRKGIGKLSALSIAGKVQVITKQKNSKTLAIELDVDKIQRAIKKEGVYYPRIIDIPPEVNFKNSGTVLILDNLKKRILKSLDRQLRQRIARRFSIFSNDFQVIVNGKEITLNDRNYFEKLEYSLIYGNYDKNNFDDKTELKLRNGKTKKGHVVHGWIGLVRKSAELQESGDNLNKISVIVRGKVALEDILSSFREGGLYTKYIMGELEADFLDSTDKEDIATSSRENFIGSDKRFSDLREFIEGELRHLERERERIKSDKGLKKALEIPAINEWYQELTGKTKSAARKFFGRINVIADEDKHRNILLKYGVLAFTHLQHKDLLDELDKISIENLETAVDLFSDLDDIEATWYHEITKGRLEVIKKLSDHISRNDLEKVVQKHIYEHLWLLDPSWDRATETPPELEKPIIKSFNRISSKLPATGRIDIKYKKTSGRHVIVELKRSSVKVNPWDLGRQVDEYIKALKKELGESSGSKAVEAVCLVGKLPLGWENSEERQRSENTLKESNIRVVIYKDLIKDARASYQEYLDKNKKSGKIQKILDSIDKHQK